MYDLDFYFFPPLCFLIPVFLSPTFKAEFEQLDVMVARKTLWRHEMAGYQMVLLMGYRIREQVETRFGLLLLDTRY